MPEIQDSLPSRVSFRGSQPCAMQISTTCALVYAGQFLSHTLRHHGRVQARGSACNDHRCDMLGRRIRHSTICRPLYDCEDELGN